MPLTPFFSSECIIFQSDSFAVEVYNGQLYVHLDLGAGPTKLRASRKRIDDGAWHEVVFRRKERDARVSVDGFHSDFKTAGQCFIILLNW